MARRRSRKRIWSRLGRFFRIRKGLRILGMALVIVFGVGLVYTSSYIYHVFKRPFVRAEGAVEVDFSWQDKSPANFAWFVTSDSNHNSLEKAAVVHVDSQVPRVVVINLPLGEISLSRGVATAMSDISRRLDMPIQGYFLVEQEALISLTEGSEKTQEWDEFNWGVIFDFPHLLQSFGGHFWSNLSLPDFVRFSKVYLDTRKNQRIEIHLDSEDFDSDSLRDLYSDNQVRTEGLEVLILNGTRVGGLAGSAASWANNLGCFVLDVANAPRQDYEKSVILARELDSYTLQRLSTSFEIEDVRELSEDVNWARRADIVVILGLDKEAFF